MVEYTDVELVGSSGFWVPGFELWNIQVELVQNKRETGNPKPPTPASLSFRFAEFLEIIGQCQHEIPLQDVRTAIVKIGIRGGTGYTGVFFEQVEGRQSQVECTVLAEFVSDPGIPQEDVLVDAAAKPRVVRIVPFRKQDQPFPRHHLDFGPAGL